MDRQLANIDFWCKRLAQPKSTASSPEKIREVIAWSKREMEYTHAHRNHFEPPCSTELRDYSFDTAAKTSCA